MKRFINWLSFLCGTGQTIAESLKKTIPTYEELKKANLRDALTEVKEVTNEPKQG